LDAIRARGSWGHRYRAEGQNYRAETKTRINDFNDLKFQWGHSYGADPRWMEQLTLNQLLHPRLHIVT
jgi:hypothetical protein